MLQKSLQKQEESNPMPPPSLGGRQKRVTDARPISKKKKSTWSSLHVQVFPLRGGGGEGEGEREGQGGQVEFPDTPVYLS